MNKRLIFAKKQNTFPKVWNHKSVYPDYVTIGKGCMIHESVIFMAQGFAYEWDVNEYIHINHLGIILIGSDVDIYSGTIVVRGTASDGCTIIGSGTKIDSMVFIAHNVKIGKNCLFSAGVIIGGSTEIGDNVRIGGHVCILNKIKIGNDCQILAGSVLRHNLEDGEIYGHNFKTNVI